MKNQIKKFNLESIKQLNTKAMNNVKGGGAVLIDEKVLAKAVPYSCYETNASEGYLRESTVLIKG